MGPGTSEEAVSADYYEFKADAAAKVVTAKALLGVVGSFKFMLALTIFRDILTQLNLVSKAFQKAHVYYNDAREILQGPGRLPHRRGAVGRRRVPPQRDPPLRRGGLRREPVKAWTGRTSPAGGICIRLVQTPS